MTKKNDGAPKSMVIRIGAQEVGGAVSQLVQDVRHVMEPDTAVRLKVGNLQILFVSHTNFPRNAAQTSSRTTRPCAGPSASPT
jgi:hypothetical protein